MTLANLSDEFREKLKIYRLSCHCSAWNCLKVDTFSELIVFAVKLYHSDSKESNLVIVMSDIHNMQYSGLLTRRPRFLLPVTMIRLLFSLHVV